MINRKTFFTLILFLGTQFICAISLKEQLNQVGYVEICDRNHGTITYDSLYVCFDELITFLQANPTWTQKLYIAKERFIRTDNRKYYSTDFFGFYDESKKEGRNQIAFYYSTHFHDFIFLYYPEFKQVPQIVTFFENCCAIQQSTEDIFNQVAAQLDVQNIFVSKYEHPPILLKVIKYFPSYKVFRPHYDGTVFSLFLDSTDNQSLLLSAYKVNFSIEDFFCPIRTFSRLDKQNSMLLIPGTFLTEFEIYPTPHIVESSGKIRYATIAFAMRPYYTSTKNQFSLLPDFKY